MLPRAEDQIDQIRLLKYPSQKTRARFGSIIIMLSGMMGCFSPREAPEKSVAATASVKTKQFIEVCQQMDKKIRSGSGDPAEIRALFLKARLAYKSVEWAIEYFEPATARMLNGAPVEEAELSGQIFPPAGLQVIEPMLWPQYHTKANRRISAQIEILIQAATKCKSHFDRIGLFQWQILDAAKLEIFRVESLGMAGFDNPLTLKCAIESATALEALRPVFGAFAETQIRDSLDRLTDNAIQYLKLHQDFNAFDRAVFIRQCTNPLSAMIGRFETQYQIPVIRYNRLLNQDAATLFDSAAFNPNAYVPDMSSVTSSEKIALGKRLFSDPVLSGSGTRSCRSCHQPERAFSDGLKRNTVIENGTLLTRNTPTLLNAALQPALFSDLRVKTLEDQSVAVIESAAEMHGSIKTSIAKLWRLDEYRKLFSLAYPISNRQSIDSAEVMNAIGSYVRSLTRLNSRFDEFMRGVDHSVTEQEIKGFNLFMGKAKCATCHYLPLFSGVFPPRYVRMESEVIGTPAEKNGKMVDPDSGRFGVAKLDSYLHAFKTPTLRNVAETAPFMHNGVFGSLEEVIAFYNNGGGNGMGMKLPNQTLSSEKLNLDSGEQKEIFAFLKSLTSLSN